MSIDKGFAANAMRRIFDLDCLRDLELVAGADQQRWNILFFILFYFTFQTRVCRFPVHWLVIAAASDHFKALRKSENAQFNVKNCDGPTLKAVIDYCYSGNINLTETNISAIWTLTHILKIDQLREKCVKFSSESLTAENCVERILRAVKFDLPSGEMQNLLNFMRSCFEAIPITQMVKIGAQNFHSLLSDGRLTASEEFVFEVMVKWVEHNETTRAKHVPTLVKYIRLKNIPTQVIYSFFHIVLKMDFTQVLFLNYSFSRALSNRSTKNTTALNLR